MTDKKKKPDEDVGIQIQDHVIVKEKDESGKETVVVNKRG